MRHIFFRIVRLAFDEIVFLVYEIYSEIKVTVIFTVREIILSIFR